MPKSKARRDFLILLCVAMITLATMYAPQTLLPFIQQSFSQYSSASIGLFMTVILIPLAIAPLLFGTFLSSLETKTVLQYGVFLMGIGSLGCYFSYSFPLLLGFRIIHGIVAPALITCIMAHISTKFHGSLLQQTLAIYVAVTILGGLVGRIASGGIASIFQSWNSAFLLLSICSFALLLPLRSFKKRSKPCAIHAISINFGEFKAILQIPGIKRLLIIEAGGLFVFIGLSTYLPFFLTSFNENASEWRISMLYLGYGLGIAVALYSRELSLFFGSKVRSIRVGILVFLFSLILFSFPSNIIIFTAMCFVCMGQFFEHSISPGLINRICPHNKGAVNGLYLSFYYTGGAMGSYIPGIVFDYFGWNALLISLGSVLCIAFIASFSLEKYVPQQ